MEMRTLFIVALLIAVLAVGFASAPPAFAAPPPNDTPAGAEVIPAAGPFPYLSAVTPDISDATVTGEPAPSCVGSFSRSIWYVFTPSASGAATLRTDTPGATVSDPVMAVYTSGGGAGGPFIQVACDDDGGAGFASQVTLEVTAGTQYWIQVSKVGTSAPGPGFTAIQIAVDLVGAPDNDAPSGAVLIPTAGPFPWFSPVIASIASATTTGEPTPSCAGSFSRSVWYRFTPPYTNWYVIATDQTATSVADTVLAIYTSAGGPAGPFSEIGCNDDGGIGGLSQVGVILYAGNEYWVQASKFGVAAPGPGAAALQLRVDVDVFGQPLAAAFSYQGQLNRNGAPVNDSCDLRFSLYDAASGGIVRTAPQTIAGVAVVNGLFTTDIDLGNQFRGDALWLETEVQCPGDNGFAVLSPRQLLNAVPYALGLRAGAQVRSTTFEPGLRLNSDLGNALEAEGGRYGVIGKTTTSADWQAAGVYGVGVNTTGVLGESVNRTGVIGNHTGEGTAPGVLGRTYATSANATAVTGVVVPTNPGSSSAAVRGTNYGIGPDGIGVWGEQFGTGYGVYGYTPNGGYGVVGSNGGSNSSGFAGVFGGRVVVNGNFSVNGSKAFVIDHPLDPANKLLYHFAVESPEVRNQYDGMVTLDQDGRAVVQLPDYFDALNADEDIHYQLTCVGSYAPVYIEQEVDGNQFTIAGGSPGLKVSWQISALRDDPYLRDNRVETETDKTGDEIGRYWYPAGYGQPAEQSLIGDQGKGGLPDAPPMEMKEVTP
jgi:hypothetical protein